MYKQHTYCRACGYAEPAGPPGIKAAPLNEQLIPVFNLDLQPLANDFCKPDEERAGFAPLEVLFCPRCTLAQLSVVVRPDILYRHYSYVTSRSRTMQGHFTLLWQLLNLECNPESVVEIGSNDGEFLAFARKNGASAVCGIDPAENLIPEANQRGLTTINGLFDEQSANMARASMPPVDVVVARHVFCHVDDWRGFMLNLDKVCHKETVVAIEVPHCTDLLRRVEFDTIYHEHLSYFTLRAMVALLEHTPFRLHRVQHFPIHGGAVVVLLRRRDSVKSAHQSVYRELEAEKISLGEWTRFRVHAFQKITQIRQEVFDLVESGSNVVGFGASAKSTVWLHAAGFKRKHIAFICDSTKLKWGCTSPGTDIPVVDEGALLREQPKHAICFAWNFRDEILENNKQWRSQGGKFIFPVPEIEIV